MRLNVLRERGCGVVAHQDLRDAKALAQLRDHPR
jgi:hypothetical protein